MVFLVLFVLLFRWWISWIWYIYIIFCIICIWLKCRSIDRWSWLLISMKEKIFLKAFLFLSYSNRQYTFEYYHNYWVIIDTWCLGTLTRENHISPLYGTSFPKRDSTGCAIFDVPLKPLGFLALRDFWCPIKAFGFSCSQRFLMSH